MEKLELYDVDGFLDDDLNSVSNLQNYSVHMGRNSFVSIESGKSMLT